MAVGAFGSLASVIKHTRSLAGVAGQSHHSAENVSPPASCAEPSSNAKAAFVSDIHSRV